MRQKFLPVSALLMTLSGAFAQPAARVAQIPGVASDQCKPGPGDRPWTDKSQTPECRALEAIAQMTGEEKLNFRGSVQRLGLNAPGGQDGPNGIAGGWNGPPQARQMNVTAFPTVVTLAATWDRGLARRFGVAMGEEFAGKGMSASTGPTVNLMRTWHWGRSGETFGEDPFLMSELVVPEILGMQSQKVIAVVKHFAGNDQENTRTGVFPDYAGIDERITEKALNEIYFPHFKAAVQKGHNGAIMCAYNQINGVFSCNNPELLGKLREWGFDGYIVPDAGFAQRSVLAAAKAGMDRVQPVQELDALIKSEQLPASTPDRIVLHMMTPNFRLGIYDAPPAGKPDANVSTPEHVKLSQEMGAAGAVLLKNKGNVLPLDTAKIKSLAMIGDDAGPNVQVMETGSAHVVVGKVKPPLDAIRERAGSSVKVNYARGTLGIGPLPILPARAVKPASGEGQGLSASYYNTADWSGKPVAERIDATVDFSNVPVQDLAGMMPLNAPQQGGRQQGAATGPPQGPPAGQQGGGGRPRTLWSARWTGTLMPPSTGVYRFSVTGGGTAQLYVDNHAVVNLMRADFPMSAQGLVQLAGGRPVRIELKYSSASNLLGRGLKLGWQAPDPAMVAEAVAAAKQSDVAIVFAGEEMGEGHDKVFLNLPGDQDNLIEAVARANPRTVVVLHTSNPVAMPWLDKVAGVIEAWYPGQEAGPSLAPVLFGNVNPSGRLPMTFPASEQQGPARNWTEYPGDGKTANFTEGVLVGYRWYDARNEEPLFPFGYGLSYTTFQYSDLQVEGRGTGRTVKVRVKNSGSREGAEVVQLYVGFPAAAAEPPRQLKGFEKVSLKPGESKLVELKLDQEALSAFDEAEHRWKIYPGSYTVQVGGSSRDARLKATFTVAAP